MLIKSNLNFLSKNIISLLNSTLNNNDIIFKQSKDNLLIPYLHNVALHSTYYPLKDGEKLNFNHNNKTVCIALGFGAGYHLFKYLNESNNKTLVIPLNFNLLKNTLENIELNNFYKNQNLKIITIDEIIEYFDFYSNDNYFLIIHPVLQNFYSNKILEFCDNIKNNLNPILYEFKTQKKFGYIWQKNIYKNLLYFFEDKFDFSPLIINKPILITGAGPSLDMNIDLIKSHRDSFYLAATDTSLKILLGNKINPDSVFSFDSNQLSYLHFLNLENNFRLFSDFASLLRFKNIKQTIVFTNHPFSKILFESCFQNIELSSVSRNIGGAIINFFLKYFKNIPIISVGIDFGYYENLSYSKGSYISEYELINSNYFKNPDYFDSSIYYKNILSQKKDRWITNSLLTDYSLNVSTNIYSLSNSPFHKFNKFNLIDFLNQNNYNYENTLIFKKPEITPDELYNKIKNYISNDYSPLIPYFLSIGKKPDENDINNFLLLTEKYLKIK